MRTDKLRIWVLCLNDFPIGSYSTEKLAKAAIAEHLKDYRPTRPAMMHYHIHDFAVDDKAAR